MSDKANKKLEAHLVADIGSRTVPFEVKVFDAPVTPKRLGGLRAFLEKHDIEHGCAITRRWENFRFPD